MDVDRLILEFERKLVLQRYSANSIANYKSSARSFLDLAKRKFSHPAEIDELAVEKYVLWKIERHRIGSSHQRMIVASIDKFYKSIYGRELKIKHLYPSRRTFALPNCLNIDEVKGSSTAPKHQAPLHDQNALWIGAAIERTDQSGDSRY